MKMLRTRAVCVLAVSGLMGNYAGAEAPQPETPRVVKAANDFLATLDDTLRSKVLYKFSDDRQRATWSNFPTGFVPRGGVDLKQMSELQRTAAMALMATVLSESGMAKVRAIMEGDEYLKSHDDGGGPGGPGGRRGGGGPRGGGPGGGGPGGGPGRGDSNGGPPFGGGGDMFGQDLYYVSILGMPSATEPWMLQFGGHHLALNITIAGEQGLLTPTLTGAQPALYTVNGKTVRPLGKESDKAFDLLTSLDDGQRKEAILNYRVGDLVLGPGHDGEKIQPEGLKVSSMNEKQQALLLDLISEWAGIVNDAYATRRMVEIQAGFAETYFAWSGPTTHDAGKGGTAYFRVQGPKVVIEYAPQGMRGDLTLHIHTMYRDPTNDYGRAITSK